MEIISKGENIVYSTGIENFLNFLRKTSQDNSVMKEDVRDCENITQDVMHTLELGKPDAPTQSRLSVLLTATRRRRRIDKNTIEITDPISLWCKQNKSAMRSLEELLGTVRKIERDINSMHTYTYKTKEVRSIVSKKGEK